MGIGRAGREGAGLGWGLAGLSGPRRSKRGSPRLGGEEARGEEGEGGDTIPEDGDWAGEEEVRESAGEGGGGSRGSRVAGESEASEEERLSSGGSEDAPEPTESSSDVSVWPRKAEVEAAGLDSAAIREVVARKRLIEEARERVKLISVSSGRRRRISDSERGMPPARIVCKVRRRRRGAKRPPVDRQRMERK